MRLGSRPLKLRQLGRAESEASLNTPASLLRASASTIQSHQSTAGVERLRLVASRRSQEASNTRHSKIATRVSIGLRSNRLVRLYSKPRYRLGPSLEDCGSLLTCGPVSA